MPLDTAQLACDQGMEQGQQHVTDKKSSFADSISCSDLRDLRTPDSQYSMAEVGVRVARKLGIPESDVVR